MDNASKAKHQDRKKTKNKRGRASSKTEEGQLRYRLRRRIWFTSRKATRAMTDLHQKLSSWLSANYYNVLLPSFQTAEMAPKHFKEVASDATPETASDEMRAAVLKRKIRSPTARAMMAQAHYRFKMLLKYKMVRSGGGVINCEEEYTSKTCSRCGAINHKLGFLPIASDYQGKCFLLPKLHHQRCVLMLQDAPQHVPKVVRKKAKKFRLVLNRDFDGVVAGCHEKHGIPWLYPPIVEGFRSLFQAGEEGVELFPGSKVRFYTVELYDVATDTLVAGELGYTVGSVYTSLTGFSRANGAGTVQLHALSKLLYLCGMKMWDLGMSMDYKMGLGAQDLERDDFLEQLYKWRPHEMLMKLDESKNEGDVHAGVSCKELLDNSRRPTGAAEESENVENGVQSEVDRTVDGVKSKSTGNHVKKEGKRKGGEKEGGHDKTTEGKREAGSKRKLSANEEQQGEEKKGKSDDDAISTAEAEAHEEKAAASAHNSSREEPN
ncbi:hypothetical protein BBJ29_005108 [Phytophthora kernoviae]|uniref:Cas12f1-like TNB domain-containing protein n=1 Tax=Phytophthora kernoviae TaxID=325452 RepID=A0A421FNV4_9STRA|nr:hypothetical protein BBJ29_005108 [Phytophthora kernoviae]